jgi:SSU ribosomal protein S27AE
MPVEKKTKKGFSPSISSYYKIDGDKTSRTKKICSRCGKGTFYGRA